MIRHVSVFLALVAVLVLFACDRQSKDVAEKPALGNPSSTLAENDAYLAKSVVVEEVAAKKPGTIDGKTLYAANCAACHQATGQGVPGAFPPLDGSSYVTGPNVERLAAIMLYGLMGEIKVKGTSYNGVMIPQGHLKDEELAAIAGYIRTAWSNKASPFEPAVFKKMRDKWGQRAQFKIEELGAEE